MRSIPWNSGRFVLLSLAALVALAAAPARGDLVGEAKKLGKKIKKGAEDAVDAVKAGAKTAARKVKDVLATDDGWDKSSGLCYRCEDQAGDPIDVYRVRATEGCSNPAKDSVTLKGKKVFREACDDHDVCYAVPGTTRIRCDKQFLGRMSAICDDLSLTDAFKYVCHTAALTWYTVVRGAAQDAFTSGQAWGKANCRKERAKKCRAGWKRVP